MFELPIAIGFSGIVCISTMKILIPSCRYETSFALTVLYCSAPAPNCLLALVCGSLCANVLCWSLSPNDFNTSWLGLIRFLHFVLSRAYDNRRARSREHTVRALCGLDGKQSSIDRCIAANCPLVANCCVKLLSVDVTKAEFMNSLNVWLSIQCMTYITLRSHTLAGRGFRNTKLVSLTYDNTNFMDGLW